MSLPASDSASAPVAPPRRAALALLAVGLVVLLGHAVVPLGEFVHRGDDAFYYFQLAADFPRLGYWSFDGVEPSNGVQPLWAALLTAVAQLAAWAGVRDPAVLGRVFVAVAAVVQFAAALVLYRLLADRVSFGTGLAAAGACLFPLGFAWGRLWGMESPLLALLLASVAAWYHLAFRPRPSTRGAVALGLLLGLACLSRLNAGLAIPCLLVAHLLARDAGPWAVRLRHAAVAGLAATLVVLPYLAWNLAQTGHPLPISGQVKAVGVARALAEWETEGGPLRRFASFVYWNWKAPVAWFVSSRFLDGLWITGLRLAHDGAASWSALAGVVLGVLALPAAAGAPRAWLRLLAERLRRLRQFAWFAVYGAVEAVIAVALYPTQTYAIPRWWLVSDELVLVALGATVAAAALAHVGRRIPAARRPVLATAGVALLATLHAAQAAAFYADGRLDMRDWNRSWNDESLRAARWIDRNLPADALVGSWNAGVVGYYTRARVVNLDGLINNAALLPYLRDDRVDEYVLRREVRYVSDMESMVRRRLGGRLALTEVYRHHSPLLDEDYVVMRVDGPADRTAGAAP